MDLVLGSSTNTMFCQPASAAAEKALGIPRMSLAGFAPRGRYQKFYDYHDSSCQTDWLHELEGILEPIGKESGRLGGYKRYELRNYYIDSEDKMRSYVYDFIQAYLRDDAEIALYYVDGLILSLKSELSYEEIGLKEIYVGNPFYNDVFYESGYFMAQEAMSDRSIIILDEALRDYSRRWGQSVLPTQAKRVVSVFDEKPLVTFTEEKRTAGIQINNMLSGVNLSGDLDLFRNEYERFARFISLWPVVLGFYMSVSVFGNCAEGIGEFTFG